MDQNLCGDTKPFAQSSDHGNRKPALSSEDLGDSCPCPDDLLEILSGQPPLFHPELDGLDRIGWIHRGMLNLIDFDQGCEHIQTIAVRRTGLGASKPLDLAKRRHVVPFRPDRLDVTRHV